MRSNWYRVAALLLLMASGFVLAQDLDRRVERRLEQVEKHLDQARRSLDQGNPQGAGKAMISAEREWKALDSYTGKYDPDHPRVKTAATRLEGLRQELASGSGEAPPPDVETPDGPPGEVEIPRQELQGAEHYLEEFEDLVRRADGKPISRGAMGEEALGRIKALGVRYPGTARSRSSWTGPARPSAPARARPWTSLPRCSPTGISPGSSRRS